MTEEQTADCHGLRLECIDCENETVGVIDHGAGVEEINRARKQATVEPSC
jgi:hypothetical protein